MKMQIAAGLTSLLVAAALAAVPALRGADAPSPAAPTAADTAQHEARIAWWREARFGMFIHWGVYSGLSGTWHGKAYGGYAEHIQRMAKIPIPVYRAEVAGKFNPTAFNAEQWVHDAKDAGMGYMIITAKHHDGFAMFDSKVSDYNIVQATPFKRDPMKELKAACDKAGIKFGFYYSHAFDWGTANGPGNDWDYDNPGGDKLLHGGADWWKTYLEFLPKAKEYVDGKSIPQIQELIANYHPAILWFDTPHKLPPEENVRILQAVRAADPTVVVNGRLVRGGGDYDSTADRPAEFSPHAGDWEGVPTTNESYGYNENDHSHKPPEHFIRLLAKAAARGGNILMNVGPMGTGQMDPKDVEILRGIGQWWKVNGESIRGTQRTPLAVQAWGESTRKGNTLFLHVFAWPHDGKLVVGGLKSNVKQAYLLADGAHAALQVSQADALDAQIAVPAAAPDGVDSVVVVQCADNVAADTTRLLQPAISPDTLRVFDAQLHGNGLKFGAGKTKDAFVDGWSKTDQSITWPVRLTQSATFDIEIVYDAERDASGSTFTVSLGDQKLIGAIKPGNNHKLNLGHVTLLPDSFDITIKPEKIKGAQLMRTRNLILTAATQ